MCPKDSNPRTLAKEEYPATLASSKFLPGKIFIKGELPRKAAFIALKFQDLSELIRLCEEAVKAKREEQIKTFFGADRFFLAIPIDFR